MRAHADLEGLTMDREVRRLRDDISRRMSEVIYNGLWYSPEREFLHQSITFSQRFTTGTVVMQLYKGNITVEGRHSDYGLYDSELSSVSCKRYLFGINNSSVFCRWTLKVDLIQVILLVSSRSNPFVYEAGIPVATN